MIHRVREKGPDYIHRYAKAAADLVVDWITPDRIGTSVGTNPAEKITSIIAEIVTGADSTDDLDVTVDGDGQPLPSAQQIIKVAGQVG